MAIPKKVEKQVEIEVARITKSGTRIPIIGIQPLILHHGSVKTHLLPPMKMTKVERETTLKHEPYEEWKERMIIAPDGPTKLLFPAASFKDSMMRAAVRLPQAVKAEVAQLVWVEGSRVPVYGIPQIIISEVRNSDINRTPDARIRPILREWACILDVSWVTPMMTQQAVANLLMAGGLITGVGDWRNEKGKGIFGQYEIVNDNDPEQVERFKRILREGGREAQEAAIAAPTAYDAETLDALTWYDEELARREQKGRKQVSRRKKADA